MLACMRASSHANNGFVVRLDNLFRLLLTIINLLCSLPHLLHYQQA